jgi:hypothetical protein
VDADCRVGDGTILGGLLLNQFAPSAAQSLPPRAELVPGARVRIRQKVTVGMRSWALEVSGVVREVKPIDTGIHTDRVRNDDFWVNSVVLEKPDGELTRLTFDENTQVEVLSR